MVNLAKARPWRKQMEEREIEIDELFRFINLHEGEFFIHVLLNEEGELCGESDRCSFIETGKRCSYYV